MKIIEYIPKDKVFDVFEKSKNGNRKYIKSIPITMEELKELEELGILTINSITPIL